MLLSSTLTAQNKINIGDTIWTKNVRIFNPPTDSSRWDEWRQALTAWRSNELKNYNAANYEKPGYEWVQSAFSTCFFIIHDSKFYNRHTGQYNVEGFIDYYTKEYGKLDAVIMWHLSPQIGFDDRNQFDFFRNMPGGLTGLKDAVARFHKQGIRFFINHNPANEGAFRPDNLRPESAENPSGGPEAMAAIVRAVDADGVFLNTYAFGGAALQSMLDKIKPGIVIEGETDLKKSADVQNQHMEWFQGWYSLPYFPGGIIRNKWLERRHMLHQVYRNTKDHTNELHAAWMNGTGVVIWENVFGIWRGWNERDKSLLRSIKPIQKRYARLFAGEGWTPLVPTLQADVFANLWEQKSLRLYTVINHSKEPKNGWLLKIKHRKGDRYFELTGGKELKAVIINGEALLSSSIHGKGVAAFLAASPSALGPDFNQFLTSQAQTKSTKRLSADFMPLAVQLKPVAATKTYTADHLPQGMVALTDTVYMQTDTVRPRESGTYDNDKFEGGGRINRKATIGKLAVDASPVTNAQYKTFLMQSGYKPQFPDNFLRHWVNGNPPAGMEGDPVVYVDLDDARAYAAWAGKRLPVIEEWQYALESGRVHYGNTRVWEWNESERYDGQVRFSMLKGGSDWAAKGSRFYSTGGPQMPDYSAKYMFMWPGLDRIRTIGFRCVADVK